MHPGNEPVADTLCGEVMPTPQPTCDLPAGHRGDHATLRIHESLSGAIADVERRSDAVDAEAERVHTDRQALKAALRHVDKLRGALTAAIIGVGFLFVGLGACVVMCLSSQ